MKRANLPAAEVLARAHQRGYAISSILPCIIKDIGNGRWLVDVEHPSYPAGTAAHPPVAKAQPPAYGPGQELKRLLSRIGITASPGCSCNAKAVQMDIWGADECLRRIDEISGWLAEEAKKRGLPYLDIAGKALIRRAISLAKAKAPGV